MDFYDEPMFGTGITVIRDDSKRGLALLKSRPRRTRQISVGPGLNQQDDDVCVCGHWAGQHSNGGKNTCGGFRCGCYTFRQIDNPDDSTMGPKCQVCKKPVLGKRVDFVADRKSSFTVTWVHVDKECVTQGSTVIEEDEVRKEVFWPKVDEAGTLEYRKITTTDTNNVPSKREPEMIGPTTGTVPDPVKKGSAAEWEADLKRARAERIKPTRAPFEIGGDEHV